MTTPITLKFEGGKEYVLEFSRETVKFAEMQGFNRSDITDKMMNRLPELFFYAFRMHHPTITKQKTDSILFDDLGGLSEAMTERLVDLFNEPYLTLVSEEDNPKNPKLTVVM